MERITTTKKLSELYLEEVKLVERFKHHDLSTGVSVLDAIFGGYRFGELVVIGARPAMGKTTFLLRSISRISAKIPVLYFIQENERRRVINELIGIKKTPEFQFVKDQVSNFDSSLDFTDDNIFLSEVPINNWQEFTILVINHVLKEQVKVVVLETEFLSSLPFSKDEFLSFLKQFAQVLNVLIIVSTCVSRNCEKREGNKKPMLQDLEISPASLKLIDTILLLYRAEYYAIQEDEYGNATKSKMEIIIAKNKEEIYPCFAADCFFPTIDEYSS